ncbi:heme ABC exporter ATP-binding protein CcmA [Hyphococcus luteus]|uniref:Heme ABC exporter ATP-binding protein CcmA n=1 Tax=Hyphococcus luteus TaxID=2058213 RepID=A0A2S7JZ67_9PROT|nr:heme ABC exporter ATP-binding protein CcmA [Marinicaulis flavus]PQA85543.1 heme ABC exporter ATP-binding protein CcmA [Marinicaulis flavus]
MDRYRRDISLSAENAGCDRAGAAIVRGVSFALKPGEGLQLFGPNGAGKSSLLSMFAGLIRPAEGALRWREGGAETDRPPEGSVFFLGHDASVKPALTAKENLDFWAKTYGGGDVRAALEAVDAMAFRHLRARSLSAGQRRRVDLARAFLAQREVWLLDEPAAAIDRDGVKIIRKLIADHLARGGVAIVATHDDLGNGFKRLELAR